MNPVNKFNLISFDFLHLYRQKKNALENPKYSPQAKAKITEELRIMGEFFEQTLEIIEGQHQAFLHLKVQSMAEKKALVQGDELLKDIAMDLRAQVNKYEKEIIEQQKFKSTLPCQNPQK